VNTPRPIPIQGELFEGTAFLKVRWFPLEPAYSGYFEQYPKRTFELAVQGKFRRPTRGVVYLGAEMDGTMERVGVFKRAICKFLLGVISNVVTEMHWSFGDAEQLAHICMPLSQSADRLIRTPPGQQPPVHGIDMFPGTVDKRNNPVDMKFDVESTYSMAWYSGNVDIARWKAVNIPGSRDVDLEAFWQELPFRLTAYELIELDKYKGLPRHKVPHTAENKRYLFCLSVQRKSVLAKRHRAAAAAAAAGAGASAAVGAQPE
jgi:hypothetical protein